MEIGYGELKEGLNEEKVILGKVICSVRNEDTVPLYVIALIEVFSADSFFSVRFVRWTSQEW